MSDDLAFAVINPDSGGITWYPLSAEQEVEGLVAGKYPRAIDHLFLISGEPLRLIASDIALAAPADFPPNPAARRIITALSAARITQPWRGHVALTEYDQDPATREWLWPTVMSEQSRQRIREAAAWIGEGKAEVMAPHRAGDEYIVRRFPIPDAGSRQRFSNPAELARHLRELPVGSSWEIIHVRDGGGTEVARYWPMTVIDAAG